MIIHGTYWQPTSSLPKNSLAADLFLTAVDPEGTPEGLGVLCAVVTPRRVWAEQYEAAGSPGGPERWRGASEIPPATEAVHSPYDTEAHYSWKRGTIWRGY